MWIISNLVLEFLGCVDNSIAQTLSNADVPPPRFIRGVVRGIQRSPGWRGQAGPRRGCIVIVNRS